MAATELYKTVLITGGTDGLGRAAAILLAEQGYRVFAGGRSAERRRTLAALAGERNLPLDAVEMDVRDDASVARALAEVHTKAGPIDVLVNSAGIGYIAVMEEVKLEHLREQFETNFFGTVRVIQAVLPEMRQRRRGRIVNMSSVAGKVAIPLFGPYSSSKFALEAISDALRLELRPFGIDVVVIEPGYIPTNFQNTSLELSEGYRAAADTSPYRMVYKGFVRSWKKSTRSVGYTPEHCARVILRAVRASRPRPRYVVTRRAALATLAKRVLPERWFDRLLLHAFRLDRPAESPSSPAQRR